jgi:hypothetical protein
MNASDRDQGLQQAVQQGFYRTTPTLDEAIKAFRERAAVLRIETDPVNVRAKQAELTKLEAVLAAWGDK